MRLGKIFILLLPALVSAQEFRFVLESDSIPVVINHWRPHCPWAGGISESYPSLCDIDNDGDYDFFIGNYWGRITHYDNIGSGLSPEYIFVTKEFAGVDLSENTYAGRTSPRFCDLDNDGDFDLYTGDFRGLIHYWENIGNINNPQFEFRTDSLAYIDVPGYSKFAFIDLDYDGDLDLLIGNYYGNIWYYENRGTVSNYDFYLVTELFADIDVGQNASPCFIDIDGDRDYDLFIGEEHGRIWYYRNDGDSVNYNFVYVTDNFEGIDVGDYASPEFADIDGDGDYDLFVGREANNNSLMGDIFFYENVGTAANPQFSFITKNYLTLDFGYFSSLPQVIDIDGDNRLDLLSGMFNTIYCLRNIGTSVSPAFSYVTDNFQGIYESGIKPCFVDIDSDGDYDLLCGEAVIPGPPEISLYRNNGTAQHPNFVLENSSYITNSAFDVNLFPTVADIDADGDYDLFINDDGDNFFFYRNDGTPQAPDFQLQTSQWQGIQFWPYNCWRGCCFADLDNDGDYDFLIQNIWQENPYNLRYYRNTGTPQNAVMVLDTTVFIPEYDILEAVPFTVDIDMDGDLDLFCGVMDGGIMFFRNMTGEFPNIILTPGVPSITIPATGGGFDFTFTVNNPSSNPFNFDAWTEVVLPTGRLMTPIILRSSLSVTAGITASRQIIQIVPGNAPPGNYQYIGNVGVFPDSVVNSDEFGFVKTP